MQNSSAKFLAIARSASFYPSKVPRFHPIYVTVELSSILNRAVLSGKKQNQNCESTNILASTSLGDLGFFVVVVKDFTGKVEERRKQSKQILFFVLRKKGSREIEKGDCGPPKVLFLDFVGLEPSGT